MDGSPSESALVEQTPLLSVGTTNAAGTIQGQAANDKYCAPKGLLLLDCCN